MSVLHAVPTPASQGWTKVPARAVTLPTPTARAYIALRSFANANGTVTSAPQKQIAARARVSEHTFRKHLRVLQDEGLVAVDKVRKHGTVRRRYRFPSFAEPFATFPHDARDAAMGLGDNALRIYLHVLQHADHESGQTYMTVSSLSDRYGIAVSQVRRGVAEAERKGVLERRKGRLWRVEPPVAGVATIATLVTGTTDSGIATLVTGYKEGRPERRDKEEDQRNTRPPAADAERDSAGVTSGPMDEPEIAPPGYDLFPDMERKPPPAPKHRGRNYDPDSPQGLSFHYEQRLDRASPGVYCSFQDCMAVAAYLKRSFVGKGWTPEQIRALIDQYFGHDRQVPGKTHTDVFFAWMKAHASSRPDAPPKPGGGTTVKMPRRWEGDR